MDIGRIDHVELLVPDRYEAARFYKAIFGFEIRRDLEFWAQDRNGPLMISPATGGPKLALFDGEPPTSTNSGGFRRIAFGVSGADFFRFAEHLKTLEPPVIPKRIAPSAMIDHRASFSIYFVDPFGYRFEITTEDHEFVRERLPSGHAVD
jgi:catechol 2,3-dioxygenase-like lactoylglutathione lyase family enzyme